MEPNIYAIIVAAIVPIIIGFVWYNPKVFGNAWMKASGLTEEQLKGGNMLVIFGVTLVLSFLLAFFAQTLVIHQIGAFGMIGGKPEDLEATSSYFAFMEEYKDAFRTYKHGAFHGVLAGVFLFFPVIAINALFERRSWKYIFINSGYWIVSLAAMGAIVCGWA
ncbi:DUF1761 domain-containing protein [Pontimicrobium sp. MEBiC06410]